MTKRAIAVVEGNDRGVPREENRAQRVERLVAFGRALSDPIRVRMVGICVCEFQDRFVMGQCKVSYHMRKLKDAGLVREEKRGKWSFYSLDHEAIREVLGDTAEQLGTGAGSVAGV